MHFGFAQLSSPTCVSRKLAFMWKLLAYCSHFIFKSDHTHTCTKELLQHAISAHYRVLCPLAQMENLWGYVSILILENQRLWIQNLDLITGKDLERQCLHCDFSVQSFQCALRSQVCLQPVAVCPSKWKLGSVSILHTDFKHLNEHFSSRACHNSVGTPAYWMGLFLEADFP